MGRLTLEQNPRFSRGLEAGVKPSPTTTPEHKQNFVSSIWCIRIVKASQISEKTHQFLKSTAKLQHELQMNTTHARVSEPVYDWVFWKLIVYSMKSNTFCSFHFLYTFSAFFFEI